MGELYHIRQYLRIAYVARTGPWILKPFGPVHPKISARTDGSHGNKFSYSLPAALIAAVDNDSIAALDDTLGLTVFYDKGKEHGMKVWRYSMIGWWLAIAPEQKLHR